MSLYYEEHDRRFVILEKRSQNVSMHIHKHFEFILVTAGTLELGIGQYTYHMEKGDFAVVFPDLIHKYTVPDKGKRRSIYILADLQSGGEADPLYTQQCPADPVIRAENLHPDIPNMIRQMVRERKEEVSDEIRRAQVNLMLARALPAYRMVDKTEMGCSDLTYRVVEYVASHYNEPISLADVAHAMGCSPYTISRIFSKLNTNFNRYLNVMRLDHAAGLLLYTDESITDICFRCGFESQRTFNRAFREHYGMTPREYRNTRLAMNEEEPEPALSADADRDVPQIG